MRDSSRTRARVGRRSAAGRFAALPLAALAAAALHARSHHLGPGSVGPTRSAEPGADPGPELEAFSIEDYEPGTTWHGAGSRAAPETGAALELGRLSRAQGARWR